MPSDGRPTHAVAFQSRRAVGARWPPRVAPGTGAADRRPAASPPGFSADTFSRQGLVSGATATEAGCRALPDGLWVGTGNGRRECLRHAAAGMEGAAGRTALVYVTGDPEGASYRSAGGRPQVDGVSEHYETSPETRRAAAEALSAATGGTPVVLLARPGMHGSSGDHARDRHTPDEVELIDDALTRLRQRYGFRDFALVGFSSGGAVVANLLARRSDVRCAVMASAPLDMAAFHRGRDGAVPDHYAMRGDMADPMRTVSAIRPGAAVFVLGDRRDRSVPASAWEAWAAAARRAGLRVHAAEVHGLDRPELGGGESRHLTTARGMEVAHACAEGAPAERILQALRSDEPLLAPRGRRLGAGEIRAAVAGRSLRGNEWSPRVDVSSFWGAGGELYYLDLRRGERRSAELRWRVEGDRLCTTRHGCDEVLSDGRALHLVKGEPPRLAVTLLEEGPGATLGGGACTGARTGAGRRRRGPPAGRLRPGQQHGLDRARGGGGAARAARPAGGRREPARAGGGDRGRGGGPGGAGRRHARPVPGVAGDGAARVVARRGLRPAGRLRPARPRRHRAERRPRRAGPPGARPRRLGRGAAGRAGHALRHAGRGQLRAPVDGAADARRSARRAGPCTTPSRPRPWPTSRPAACRSTSTTPRCPSWPRARAGPRRSP